MLIATFKVTNRLLVRKQFRESTFIEVEKEKNNEEYLKAIEILDIYLKENPKDVAILELKDVLIKKQYRESILIKAEKEKNSKEYSKAIRILDSYLKENPNDREIVVLKEKYQKEDIKNYNDRRAKEIKEQADKMKKNSNDKNIQIEIKNRKKIALKELNKMNIEAQKEIEIEKKERRREGFMIGMTKEEVLQSSWGKPNDINKTITEYATSEQWVYDNSNYLYFEDGILTTIQN